MWSWQCNLWAHSRHTTHTAIMCRAILLTLLILSFLSCSLCFYLMFWLIVWFCVPLCSLYIHQYARFVGSAMERIGETELANFWTVQWSVLDDFIKPPHSLRMCRSQLQILLHNLIQYSDSTSNNNITNNERKFKFIWRPLNISKYEQFIFGTPTRPFNFELPHKRCVLVAFLARLLILKRCFWIKKQSINLK